MEIVIGRDTVYDVEEVSKGVASYAQNTTSYYYPARCSHCRTVFYETAFEAYETHRQSRLLPAP